MNHKSRRAHKLVLNHFKKIRKYYKHKSQAEMLSASICHVADLQNPGHFKNPSIEPGSIGSDFLRKSMVSIPYRIQHYQPDYRFKIVSLICKIEKKQTISYPIPFSFQESRKIWYKYRLKEYFPLRGFKYRLNSVMCPTILIQKDFSNLFNKKFTSLDDVLNKMEGKA